MRVLGKMPAFCVQTGKMLLTVYSFSAMLSTVGRVDHLEHFDNRISHSDAALSASQKRMCTVAESKKVFTKQDAMAVGGNAGVSIKRLTGASDTDYSVSVGGKVTGIALRCADGSSWMYDQTGKVYPTMAALKMSVK